MTRPRCRPQRHTAIAGTTGTGQIEDRRPRFADRFSVVAQRQLHHIMEMAKRDNINVQVIPSGSREVHAAHAGMFVLFRFPKASPIVHLEHYGPASFLYNAKDVAVYERAEQPLRATAMSESESLALMAKIATDMEQEEG